MFHKFPSPIHKAPPPPQKKLPSEAILLSTVGIFCEAIFASKFGPCMTFEFDSLMEFVSSVAAPSIKLQ